MTTAATTQPATAVGTTARTRTSPRSPMRNPWRRPIFLESFTWLYLIWSLVPIVLAVLFSFNKGKSQAVRHPPVARYYLGFVQLRHAVAAPSAGHVPAAGVDARIDLEGDARLRRARLPRPGPGSANGLVACTRRASGMNARLHLPRPGSGAGSTWRGLRDEGQLFSSA